MQFKAIFVQLKHLMHHLQVTSTEANDNNKNTWKFRKQIDFLFHGSLLIFFLCEGKKQII